MAEQLMIDCRMALAMLMPSIINCHDWQLACLCHAGAQSMNQMSCRAIPRRLAGHIIVIRGNRTLVNMHLINAARPCFSGAACMCMHSGMHMLPGSSVSFIAIHALLVLLRIGHGYVVHRLAGAAGAAAGAA